MDYASFDAGLGRRYLALMVDSSLSWLIASWIEPHNSGKRLALQLGILFIEKSLLTLLQGASFGQKLLSIKVIDVKTGVTPTPARIALRTLLVLLVIPAVFTSNGRRLHDILAHTTVVRTFSL